MGKRAQSVPSINDMVFWSEEIRSTKENELIVAQGNVRIEIEGALTREKALWLASRAISRLPSDGAIEDPYDVEGCSLLTQEEASKALGRRALPGRADNSSCRFQTEWQAGEIDKSFEVEVVGLPNGGIYDAAKEWNYQPVTGVGLGEQVFWRGGDQTPVAQSVELHLLSENTYVTIFGDIEPREAVSLIKQLIGNL